MKTFTLEEVFLPDGLAAINEVAKQIRAGTWKSSEKGFTLDLKEILEPHYEKMPRKAEFDLGYLTYAVIYAMQKTGVSVPD